MTHGEIRPTDVALLRCPECGGSLEGGLALRCLGCRRDWPIKRGLARLFTEQRVHGTDRLLRALYDAAPGLHDPMTRFLLPLIDGTSEDHLRQNYMPLLELDALPEGPVRILETGVGSGANLPLVRAQRPRGTPTEIWGLDLSEGMLGHCRRRLRREPDPDLRLLMADAHHLPFPDDSFDRVFHVGGIGGFEDPALALREMARVAKPGTPIVAVDEQLDRSNPGNLAQRLLLRAVIFWDPEPRAPIADLPAGAYDVYSMQASRSFYALRFRSP